MNLKVGQKVMIHPELSTYGKYSAGVIDSMVEFAGKLATVVTVDPWGNYKLTIEDPLTESPYSWSREVLIKMPMGNQFPTFEVGDNVVIIPELSTNINRDEGVFVRSTMLQYAGLPAKITFSYPDAPDRYKLDIDDQQHFWSSNLLTPLSKEGLEEGVKKMREVELKEALYNIVDMFLAKLLED